MPSCVEVLYHNPIILFKRLLFLFISFAGFLPVSAQGIDDTVIFKANVYFFFSEKPVHQALARTSVDSTLTDEKGFFRIRVSKRDTIFVWLPGFQEVKAPVRTFGNVRQFYLKEDKETMLDEVVVNKQREHYLKKYVPKDTIKMYTVVEDDRVKTGDDRNYMKDMPLGTGLVSELAAQFSKKEQERRKYLDIKADEILAAVYWKVLDSPDLQKDFMNQYGITEEEYIDYKHHFHKYNGVLYYSTDENKIRKAFFSQYIDYIRYVKY